jgi:hypothetical protein
VAIDHTSSNTNSRHRPPRGVAAVTPATGSCEHPLISDPVTGRTEPSCRIGTPPLGPDRHDEAVPEAPAELGQDTVHTIIRRAQLDAEDIGGGAPAQPGVENGVLSDSFRC